MLRWIVGLPCLFLLVLFALSNPMPVPLTLWPFDISMNVPLSLAMLCAMGVAFLLGALIVWISSLSIRRRARRAEQMVKQLEARLGETPQHG